MLHPFARGRSVGQSAIDYQSTITKARLFTVVFSCGTANKKSKVVWLHRLFHLGVNPYVRWVFVVTLCRMLDRRASANRPLSKAKPLEKFRIHAHG